MWTCWTTYELWNQRTHDNTTFGINISCLLNLKVSVMAKRKCDVVSWSKLLLRWDQRSKMVHSCGCYSIVMLVQCNDVCYKSLPITFSEETTQINRTSHNFQLLTAAISSQLTEVFTRGCTHSVYRVTLGHQSQAQVNQDNIRTIGPWWREKSLVWRQTDASHPHVWSDSIWEVALRVESSTRRVRNGYTVGFTPETNQRC